MKGLSLAYHSLYFVDREEALAVVLEKTRALPREEPVRNHTTIYYGPRGSGKSWLLRELHHRLQNTQEFQNRVTPPSSSPWARPRPEPLPTVSISLPMRERKSGHC